MITSPYNFVPLSEKVVKPFWAKHVSHDIPFENAQSGVLKVKIKAESPVYVRNGVSRNSNNELEKNSFNKIGNQYFIPGSSVKGMIRSVLEIMSFGRMVNKVNDDKYSVRDFYNPKIYPKETFANDIYCGYLKYENGQYLLKDCGKPGRIAQETLSKSFHEHFSAKNKYDKDKNPNGWNPNKDYSKSAKYKYDKFQSLLQVNKFSFERQDNGRDIYIVGEDKFGQIVFTGQPGLNNCKEVFDKKLGKNRTVCGKHFEFIFFEKDNEFFPLSKDEKKSGEIIKNFFFAYYDHDKTNQKEDWEWRKEQLDDGEKIPVFFRRNNDGTIKDMGLSMLYKITYENSVTDLINKAQADSNSFDLAETIFGYTEGNNALKGRVHLGHAFAKGQITPLAEKREVLAGPKASYYPNYIEQDIKQNANGEISGDYKTYMNSSAKIRGWKRYPVRSGSQVIPNQGTDNVSTKFIPLPAGTEFTLDIHYHNLLKEELGALISAITFHNTPGLYHSIGSGKPLGYGKVSVEINHLDDTVKMEMLKSFELFMDYSLGHSTPLWSKTLQIKELTAMAKPGNDDTKLKYMNDVKDFVNAKGGGRNAASFALQKYSVISGNNVDVNCLISEEELKEAKNKYKAEEDIFNNLADIKMIKENLLKQKTWELERALEIKKNTLFRDLKKRKEEIIQQEEREKEKSQKNKELLSGINLNGVTYNKTIDGLTRALKYWTESLGGSVGDAETEQIKTRLNEIYRNLKPRDKQSWLNKLKSDLPKLEIYLIQAQIHQLEAFINTLN